MTVDRARTPSAAAAYARAIAAGEAARYGASRARRLMPKTVFPQRARSTRAPSTSPRRCSTASTATTGCSAQVSAAAKQRFETADWHGQQRAQRERIEFYDQRVSEARGAAGDRVQGRRAADGRLAAGQAALHRPAGRPPPARAGRDLLQLGHDQDPAPQLLPQRLHLRAAGGLDRVHRERRAGGDADLPRLLPDARDACATPGVRIVDNFQLQRAVRGPATATSTRGARRCCARSATRSSCAPTSRSRCCRACSSATRAPTWSARSSTASARRRSRCRSCTTADGQLDHRRRAVRRGRPADAVQLRARLLHGRHGGARRPTCSSCAR